MTHPGRPDIRTRLWLGLAATAALFCQPAGIAAIIFVALAMKAENMGDFTDAAAKLKTARIWTIVGIAVGVPATLLYIAFLFSDTVS